MWAELSFQARGMTPGSLALRIATSVASWLHVVGGCLMPALRNRAML